MRVYISIDMEGVAGVVHADQCRRGADDYPAACALMTGEADAAAPFSSGTSTPSWHCGTLR